MTLNHSKAEVGTEPHAAQADAAELNRPDPTNGWTRAEMLDHLMLHFHEAVSGMQYMPDMAGSQLHRDMVQELQRMRAEFRLLAADGAS